ncbi:protein of unknown function [Cupriavidus taiwanensis]|uniref:Uncharacterized protein n=2 Tax=Cupriavidus taiwanensis TaxID=164546 RepID=A0A375IEH4_9BURK|nr:protein of unknown function [Cupriavidus taiwanensis]
MTPDEVRALQGLVESLVVVAFFSGMFGAFAYSLLCRVIAWLFAEPVGRRFREYRKACEASFARGAGWDR